MSPTGPDECERVLPKPGCRAPFVSIPPFFLDPSPEGFSGLLCLLAVASSPFPVFIPARRRGSRPVITNVLVPLVIVASFVVVASLESVRNQRTTERVRARPKPGLRTRPALAGFSGIKSRMRRPAERETGRRWWKYNADEQAECCEELFDHIVLEIHFVSSRTFCFDHRLTKSKTKTHSETQRQPVPRIVIDLPAQISESAEPRHPQQR